jgi:pSer/pThr/pTyr-binding forkhead associated (FHA) protein
MPAAAAPETAETYPPERPTLFEEPRPAEEKPAPATEAVALAVEASPSEAPTVLEEATDDQPLAAVARPGGLTLRLESERGSRSTFEVTKSGATIGRGPESTIQLADLSVSRKHARITYKQGSYWLSDLGSMGGTWIDGTKLAAPRRVATGQTIDIGVCRLVVVAAAEGEKTGAAKGPSNAA